MVDQPIQPEQPITPERIPAPPVVPEQTPRPVETAPTPTPEQPAVETEVPREAATEKQSEGLIDEGIDALKKRLRKPKKKKPTKVPEVRDEITLKVEKIMQEGLADAYRELTPVQQQEFKIKGEETALKIRQLMRSTRVKVKSVFKLLIEWLKLLPGINRFFLEQEAKIKADKILTLKDQILGRK